MLKLHSLEIAGFKSFLDDVEVRFAPGLTAIVGPNGCGKSNLTDAINWVLGEQSAKSLRGSKMEDVIFNGSAQRKPVGMAEVTLVMACDPSFPRSVEGRIRIGRQVFRTGESRYRINGKVVRLKEIKDLLMDTGLGYRAYSVIEQGKIGLILSGKPQERRKLLEEAAGITRYKARKRVAEIKLEETLSNLQRLDDIISEVERALRSLKRQASAARRYQAKDAEYKDLLRRVLLGRWVLQKGSLDELTGHVENLENRAAELEARLAEGEAALAEARKRLDELSQALGQRHSVVAELAATIEGRQEFLKGAGQRVREMDERLEKGRRQAEERKKQSSELDASLGQLDERAKTSIAERNEAASLVTEDERRLESAQREVKAAENRLEGLRRELMSSMAEVDKLRSGLQRASTDAEKHTYRLRYLGEERERVDKQLAEADATLKEAAERIEGIEKELADREQEKARLDGDLQALLRREAELSEERRRLETELAGLRQRRQILIQLSKQHDERRRALVDALGTLGHGEPKYLADLAAPAEGFEDAIDHFLGELADAVVLDSGELGSSLELAAGLTEANYSGTFVRPLDSGPEAKTPEDPAIRAELAEALDLSPELARAMPPAYLVDAADDAARLAALHPGAAFISKERLWARGGLLFVQGGEAAPGVLARERELQSIADQIPQTEKQLEEAKDTLRRLVTERTGLAERIEKVNARASELRRELAVAQARRHDVEKRRQKVSVSHQTIADEQDELESALAATNAQRAELQANLVESEKSHRDLEGAFDRAKAEVDAAKERRQAIETESAGRRGQLALLEERLSTQNQEAARVRRQITYTEEQLRIWAEEDGTLQHRLEELGDEREKAESELQVALERRYGAQEEVLAAQKRLDEQRETIRGLEEKVARARKAREDVRGNLEQRRVERASARQDAEHLSASYRETFGKLIPGTVPHRPEPIGGEQISLEENDASPDPQPSREDAAATEPGADVDTSPEADASQEEEAGVLDIDPALPGQLLEDDVELPERVTAGELTQLESDLSRIKAMLERLGPVNVLAAKEYEDQEERREFLHAQRHDVATSVESLKSTIAEINELSAERFKETFEEVNRVFGETFIRLFRGGEAYMSLFDEEDLLETGIEIVARPPGKRPQNISLLSGGEKALTAIALLFALFQTKPSPFCILDEVDAPLDDANVLRFVETLGEMATETQFLVVTHNKLTMEVAQTLYGVTMEEKGVSKLVQAQIEDLHPKARAANDRGAMAGAAKSA